VASIAQQQAYFTLLDSKCSYFKSTAGGIGWFAHIYSDAMEPEYGIYDSNGNLKFDFKPRVNC